MMLKWESFVDLHFPERRNPPIDKLPMKFSIAVFVWFVLAWSHLLCNFQATWKDQLASKVTKASLIVFISEFFAEFCIWTRFEPIRLPDENSVPFSQNYPSREARGESRNSWLVPVYPQYLQYSTHQLTRQSNNDYCMKRRFPKK